MERLLSAFRTFSKRVIGKMLENIKLMTAGFTSISIRRHISLLYSKMRNWQWKVCRMWDVGGGVQDQGARIEDRGSRHGDGFGLKKLDDRRKNAAVTGRWPELSPQLCRLSVRAHTAPRLIEADVCQETTAALTGGQFRQLLLSKVLFLRCFPDIQPKPSPYRGSACLLPTCNKFPRSS